MKKDKGDNPRNWNWQMRANRHLEEIKEEEEYLRNVEKISH